jgi:hypothetical protein
MTHLGGSIGRCHHPIGAHKLAGRGQGHLDQYTGLKVQRVTMSEEQSWSRCSVNKRFDKQILARQIILGHLNKVIVMREEDDLGAMR